MSTQVAPKMKVGYRRTESEPSNASVNDIRCKFETTSDDRASPEVGLAFGVKRPSACSTPTSNTSSPLIPKKSIMESFMESKGSNAFKHSPKRVSDSKLDAIISKTNRITSAPLPEAAIDKYKKAIVKPTSLIIPTGSQSLNKQLPIDKLSLIGIHNAGIVNSRKQMISSPVTYPPIAVPPFKVESPDKGAKLEVDEDKNITAEEKSIPTVNGQKNVAELNGNSIASSTNHSRKSSNCSENGITRHQHVRLPLKQEGSDELPHRVDSLFEPGMDYTKLKKVVPSKGKNAKSPQGVSHPSDKLGSSPKVTSQEVQLTASNLKKVSECLAEYKAASMEESGSCSGSLSKSPSISSTCSSMDSLNIEYINGTNSHKVRRRDTKPPQNIVARRTQLFEKSLDEINSISEEAEAYRKVKEAGFGTVFSASATPSTHSKPKKEKRSSTSTDSKTFNTKPSPFMNNNTKLADKNTASANPKEKKHSASKPLTTSKPLPSLPASANSEKAQFSKSPPPVTALKPKVKAPPPKPPRTFEHPVPKDVPSTKDLDFDPGKNPRQAGDGEENHGYEGHVSCQQPHVYTSVSVSTDPKPYTTTTTSNIDGRPYTSLTTACGSGEDDSVAGSENAYDTLGKSSVASSYEHYDTISASELDSDISRPPTLPRRPSNLRPRPLTTAFGNLDINKNPTFLSELSRTLSDNTQTIKEVSPTAISSPTKTKGPFKLKYLLPKARRKADEIRKATSMENLLDDKEPVMSTSVHISNTSALENSWSSQNPQIPDVPIDEAGYALPDIKGTKRADPSQLKPAELAAKSQNEKALEKIRLKLNQAFSALRRHVAIAPTLTSDGEEEERPPDPEVLEERLRHCTNVKEFATYASVEQIKGFMTRVYAQLYDYAVIVALRKNPETNTYEPYVKFKFPPQLNVEQTTVPQFCYPDAHIWHRCTDYKSEAFSFVLTDVTGTRQYGYCKRMLPPDLNNLPRTAEVICIVSPLHAPKLYNQVLDEVEKRGRQNSVRAEEFLQAVYGRPLPSPGHSVTIRATNVYEEPESLVFTRSPDSQREGIDYECLLNLLSVSQIIKIFASILLERKIIFIAEKLSILSSCVHAFASLIYPFSWQHTFIPLLPPNLIDVVCAPTPFIVGLLSTNAHLLAPLDDEMEEVLVIDLDNHKFLQRMGDEKTILPKKLHRALLAALDMAKSENQPLRSMMVAESFLRFFLETTGSFNDFMIHVPGVGRQFQKEEFICNAANAPSIMDFLQWFTATQMFEVYMTERENDRNIISGTFEGRVSEFHSEDHAELLQDSRRFRKFKLFGKNKKK